MAMPRESSFLPTIKCSQCHNQVEISMMGDHLCIGEAAAEPSPPPDTKNHERFENSYNQPPPPMQKYGRPPPSLDTRAANRPYLHQGQLTPGSHSGDSQGPSPMTPNARPGFGRPDDYFSPQIASGGPSTPLPSQTRRPGGYGGFGDQSGHDLTHSPEKQGGFGVMQRMDSITPGPFDANRRPSVPRNAFPRRKESLAGKIDMLEEPSRSFDRPGTANSNASIGSNGNIAPPRQPRQNGYGGFGAPPKAGEYAEPAPLGGMNRSETFPKPSFATESPFRTPSAPGPRPERLRQNSAFESGRRPSMGPDTSRPPPPRRSIMHPKTAAKSGSVDLAAEFGIGNPYHTPSDSASSGYSNFSSHLSQSSNQTSPARSQNRQPSDTSNVDDLMNDLETSMEGLRTKGLRINPAAQAPPRTQSPMVESPYGMSPRDDHHEPGFQGGRRGDLSPRSYDRPAPSPRFASSPQNEPHLFGPALQARPRNDSARMGTSPPSPRALPPSRKGSRDPGAPPRGDCKACGLAITGKSISSADGRLTGKYHKACFVCTTCSEPFASAEFYVLNDKPYCEQHYHKLNGSLCGSCTSGIEGQYLEDESTTKYHVGCFRCLDCGRSLSDGYFEVDGKSYCEPDAWKRVHHAEPEPYAQPPPPRAGPRPVNGLPGRPGPRGPPGMPRAPYGLPSGNRLAPAAGGKPRPQMNKRMTRLGNM